MLEYGIYFAFWRMFHRKESQELNDQLAEQHKKVASWKSKQNSENIEHLISERMIEQQIKLKMVNE